MTDFFTNIDMPKLSTEQIEWLDSPITENEIRRAVSSMKTGKSPGVDCFPAEYYKQYIDVLAPILKDVYNEAFTLTLPPTFYEALISVIPKKDRDAADPANYRPLSLINMDCKILTKILALLLESALPSIIHTYTSSLFTDGIQVGFMKNRSSTDNMRRLLHLILSNRTGTDSVVALSRR